MQSTAVPYSDFEDFASLPANTKPPLGSTTFFILLRDCKFTKSYPFTMVPADVLHRPVPAAGSRTLVIPELVLRS